MTLMTTSSFGAWRHGETTGLALAMLLGSLGTSIANVALPSLAEAFSVPMAQVQWVVLAYVLALCAATVPAGRLGDLYGHDVMLVIGLVLFTAGAALAAVAPDLGILIPARGIQGIGAAFLTTLTVAKVREASSPDRMGRTMGLLATMSAVGTALGPSLGGLLISAWGWRADFACMVPLGCWALLLAHAQWRRAPKRRKRALARFDYAGLAALTAALAAYAVAMTSPGTFGSTNAAALVIACLTVLSFVWVEMRSPAPLVRFADFRSRSLIASLAINAVVSTTMMATLVVGPFYLSRGLGLEAAAVGLVVSVGPIGSTISGVVAGRITDRYGSRAAILAGLLMMTCGVFGLAGFSATIGLSGYILALVILTPGYQLFQAANNVAVMSEAAIRRQGAASGLLGLSRNFGLITGASLIGTIFAVAVGGRDVLAAAPQAITSGLIVTFGCCGLVMLFATVAALLFRIGRSPAEPT